MPRRKKRGRKPVKHLRKERRVYLSDPEWDLIQEAAMLAPVLGAESRQTAVWMRRALVAAAKRMKKAAWSGRTVRKLPENR